ncbi:MAG: arabinose isomerase, partial [Anaerolineales bacterium]
MKSDLIPRRKPLTANIGIFGVGLDIYWQQFPDLLDALMEYMDVFEEMVQAQHVHAVNFGMIDNAEAAYAILKEMKAADLDLVFCDMLTYATSSTFGIIIRELDVPIVLVALQPLV